MTKKDIVRVISESMGLTQLDVKEIVQKTFDTIVDTLATQGRIELRNFGVFEVKERAPRKARNPKTGEEVMVPARRVVTFKPGKEMEERIAATMSGADEAGPTETAQKQPSAPPPSPPPPGDAGASQASPPPQTGFPPPGGFPPRQAP